MVGAWGGDRCDNGDISRNELVFPSLSVAIGWRQSGDSTGEIGDVATLSPLIGDN
jgi:hypothetical protein